MRRRISYEQQLELTLDRIYEAPLGDAGWEPALAAIGDLLGAENVDLSFLDQKALTSLRWEHARIDADAAQKYASEYLTADVRDVHPRMPVAMAMREGEVVADSDFWTLRERRQKAFFSDYYIPMTHCIESVMGTVVRRSSGPWVVLATHFTDPSRARPALRSQVHMLLGHLRRAVETEEKLSRLQREKDVLRFALDQQQHAMAMIDSSGCVVQCNAAATALFRSESRLSLAAGGKLLLSHSEARARWDLAIQQCASPIASASSSYVAAPEPMVVAGGDRPPLVLRLQPLPQHLAGTHGAVALLFIDSPGAVEDVGAATLQKLFGFTPAEALLAQSLAQGLSLQQIAQRDHSAYETLRKRLRSVMAKMRVRRQAEIVGLIHQYRSTNARRGE